MVFTGISIVGGIAYIINKFLLIFLGSSFCYFNAQVHGRNSITWEDKRNTLTEFNSNNTKQLNLEETKAKIASLAYIQKELAKMEN